MLIRQLEYLVALDRERHFARAAAACHVTQPALSAGLRKLEAELAVPIVRRGNRFEGFTPEGDRVLRWAHRVLSECGGLREDTSAMRDGQAGLLRIGSVPAAAVALADLTTAFERRHPRVRLRITEMAPNEIHKGLAELDLDAGVTHLDDQDNARRPWALNPCVPLYRERYILLAPAEGRFAGRQQVRWAELDQLPLCVLSRPSPERGILDRAVGEAEGQVSVRLEASSAASVYAYARSTASLAVLASSWLRLFGLPPGMRALPLVEPEAATWVGLVARGGEPRSPLVEEFMAASRELRGGSQVSDLSPAAEEGGGSSPGCLHAIPRQYSGLYGGAAEDQRPERDTQGVVPQPPAPQ